MDSHVPFSKNQALWLYEIGRVMALPSERNLMIKYAANLTQGRGHNLIRALRRVKVLFRFRFYDDN